MTFLMFDLYNLFVENIFGSFWMAVLGIAGIIFLFMIFGRMSGYSIVQYLSLFLLAMTLGYGYAIISIPVMLIIIVMFVNQLIAFIGRQA